MPGPTSSRRSPRCAASSSSAGRRRARPTDYRFSHLLVRDAAYARLLKRTRARLHERFVAWFTDTVGSRLTEYEEILGYHLEQSYRYRADLGTIDDTGGGSAPRRRGSSSAGRRALARGDMPAAANLLQRAAALLGEKDPARALLLLEAGEAAVDIGELSGPSRCGPRPRTGRLRPASSGSPGRRRSPASSCATPPTPTPCRRSVVELVEREIPELEAMDDDRALVRAFRLLTYVHGTGARYADAAAPPTARSGMRPPPATR